MYAKPGTIGINHLFFPYEALFQTGAEQLTNKACLIWTTMYGMGFGRSSSSFFSFFFRFLKSFKNLSDTLSFLLRLRPSWVSPSSYYGGP